ASFEKDSTFPQFNEKLHQAKAVIIVPTLVKAGFILGGEGGKAVALARDASGKWSAPAFFGIGSGRNWRQAGGQVAEVVFLVMSDKALESLLDNKIKFGADAGIAVVTVGQGVEAGTTGNFQGDILAYARAQGLYAGISFEGAVVASDDDWNRTYYGHMVSAHDILMSGKAENVASLSLRRSLEVR